MSPTIVSDSVLAANRSTLVSESVLAINKDEDGEKAKAEGEGDGDSGVGALCTGSAISLFFLVGGRTIELEVGRSLP